MGPPSSRCWWGTAVENLGARRSWKWSSRCEKYLVSYRYCCCWFGGCENLPRKRRAHLEEGDCDARDGWDDKVMVMTKDNRRMVGLTLLVAIFWFFCELRPLLWIFEVIGGGCTVKGGSGTQVVESAAN